MEDQQKNPFAIRRAEIKKTQRQIAAEVGVAAMTVWNWENSKYVPSAAFYDLLAAAYQRDRAWIVETVMQLAQPATSAA
jgi:transcriptional regulator with XRE-family HTH domain